MSSFKKPEPPKRLRVLLIGSWGSGKSHVKHTFPGLCDVDTQHGESSHFVDRMERGEFPPFLVANASNFAECRSVIKSLRQGEAETIGIDSLTPLHRECVARHTNDKGTTLEAPIEREEAEFGEFLRSLPFHIVATAEAREVRAKAGDKVKDLRGNEKTVGERDVVVEKVSARFKDGIGHVFDYIFVMRRDGKDSIARCIKSKDESKIARFEEIRNLSYDILAKRVLHLKPAQTDDDAPITQEAIDAIEGLAAAMNLPSNALRDKTKEVAGTVKLSELKRGQGRQLYRALQLTQKVAS